MDLQVSFFFSIKTQRAVILQPMMKYFLLVLIDLLVVSELGDLKRDLNKAKPLTCQGK